jgi:hypothetical protein
MYDIQQCLICRPSDSTVSEYARIEPKTVVANTALAVRRYNHSARVHPNRKLYLAGDAGGRYVLSRGGPALQLAKRLPPGHCLAIRAELVDQQIEEVFRLAYKENPAT